MTASRKPQIYLAGPTIFMPDKVERGEELKRLCAAAGCEGLYPLDGDFGAGLDASVTVDLTADLVRALDAWIVTQPEARPERAKAIAFALRDWLTGLGMLPAGERLEGLR